MLLRTYARGAALALGLAAMAGFLGAPVPGVAYALLCLGTGSIFAYVGFGERDASLTRAVVGGLGTLHLVSGVALAVLFVALGFPFERHGYAHTLGLMAFGGLCVACARSLPCDDSPAGPPR